jgi:uncharacterized Zn finger protein (UPF0148 family)
VRELESCPACGSGDVGGASGIVHCYKCKAEVRAATTEQAAEKWNIRAIFMRHGFTIKDGQTDLKDYVYAAAYALLEHDRARRGNPGEDAMNAAARDLPDGYGLEVNLERGAGWIDIYRLGEVIEHEENTDAPMTTRIRDAIQAAIDDAKERGNG